MVYRGKFMIHRVLGPVKTYKSSRATSYWLFVVDKGI